MKWRNIVPLAQDKVSHTVLIFIWTILNLQKIVCLYLFVMALIFKQSKGSPVGQWFSAVKAVGPDETNLRSFLVPPNRTGPGGWESCLNADN